MALSKTILRAFFLIFLLLSLFGCYGHGDVRVLRLAHVLPVDHPVHKGMEYLAKRVDELSGGKLRIKIYPGGQLGSERECLESLQIGSLDMTKVNSAVVENFVPSVAVLSLPYLFSSTKHRWKVFNGEIGKQMLHDGEPFWLHGLCFYETGTRNFYLTKVPVYKPEDLKGLKIRVMRSHWSIESVKALGASVTPIAFGELYAALAAGVVDGAENNIPTFYQSRHWEICKYFVLDGHTAPSDMLLISTHTWKRLSDQEKDWLMKATKESVDYQRKLWYSAENTYLDIMKKGGVQVIQPDTLAFKEKVKPLYEKLKQSHNFLYPLVEKIKQADFGN